MHEVQQQLKKGTDDEIDSATATEHVGDESEYTRFVLGRLKEHKQTTESQRVRQILSRILNHDVRTSYRRFSKYGKNDKRSRSANRLRGRGSHSNAELPSVQKLVEQRASQKVGCPQLGALTFFDETECFVPFLVCACNAPLFSCLSSVAVLSDMHDDDDVPTFIQMRKIKRARQSRALKDSAAEVKKYVMENQANDVVQRA